MMPMVTEKIRAYVALGSNLGDRMANLDQASSRLAAYGGIYLDRSSPTYASPPAEVPDQPPFFNRVLALEVWLPPRGLLAACRRVEDEMGRVREADKGPRVIDADILLFGEAVIREPELTIPHEALTRRAFFLQPLKDLMGDAVIPGTGSRISQLLAALAPYDLTEVKTGYY